MSKFIAPAPGAKRSSASFRQSVFRSVRAAATTLSAVAILAGVVDSQALAADLVVGQSQRVVASDPAEFESFGFSVAMDGDTAVVGAPGDDTAQGVDAGVVYVFINASNTWQPHPTQPRLTAPNGQPRDNFGEAVALSGTGLLVGAPNRSSSAGTAYVFRRSAAAATGAWAHELQLTPTGLAPSDIFGGAVSLSGTTALIGAVGDTTNSGAAYVFFRSGGNPLWVQQGAKLVPNPRVSNSDFGSSVALSGNTALIGAPGQTDSGAAFMFQRTGTTWAAGQSLVVPAPLPALASGDAFGTSVALSGDGGWVGAPRADVSGILEAGSAFFFERSGSSWVGRQRVDSPNPVDSGGFGSSVAMAEDRTLIGAPVENVERGQAYLFSRDGVLWEPSAAPLVSGSADFAGFGSSVAVGPGAVLVGAPYEVCALGGDCGGAYLFAVSDAPAAVPALSTSAAALLAALFALCGVLALCQRQPRPYA